MVLEKHWYADWSFSLVVRQALSLPTLCSELLLLGRAYSSAGSQDKCGPMELTDDLFAETSWRPSWFPSHGGCPQIWQTDWLSWRKVRSSNLKQEEKRMNYATTVACFLKTKLGRTIQLFFFYSITLWRGERLKSGSCLSAIFPNH